MSLVYDLKRFEKSIGYPIAIKRLLLFESGNKVEEYVQGILRKVDVENATIEIEQYLTFLDWLEGNKEVPSKRSKFKNTEFTLLSILKG